MKKFFNDNLDLIIGIILFVLFAYGVNKFVSYNSLYETTIRYMQEQEQLQKDKK